MNERRTQIERLFEAALEHPPEARAEWLDETCSEDPELCQEVRRLLTAHERAEGILDQPIGSLAADVMDNPKPERAGERIGPYRLLREIGRGGMGTVYLAERADGQFKQRVAVKVLRQGVDTEAHIRRFLAERQILASLQHPHIARLYDGGVTEEEQPYFVMEYVEGQPIDHYCGDRDLSVKDRLRLFATVCEAVQYAHQNLIVHRDLKPSNILVTKDGTGKLLDFGIAKPLDPEAVGPGSTPTTRTGLGPMTPEYASPEQVRETSITTASDVYQLGLVLYELLTGQRPYRVEGRSPGEIEQVICEETPTRPSMTVVKTEQLRKTLHGDLDTICLKALRKEPLRRYTSAGALAEDIKRYLKDQPVAARPDTMSYRLRTFVRRHRWGVAVAIAFVLLLVGYAATVTLQARQIARERDKAEQATSFLVDVFEVSDPGQAHGETVTARELLDEGAKRVHQELADQPEVQATLLHALGQVYRQIGLYSRADTLLKEALVVRRARLNAPHSDLAESLHELGLLRREQGRYDRAEVLHREALALHQTLYGDAHARTAQSQFALAMALHDQGNFAEATTLLQTVITTYRQLPDEITPEYGASLSVLGGFNTVRRNYPAAESLYREALDVYRTLYGRIHPRVAESLAGLSSALEGQGQLAAADSLLQEAAAIQHEVYPDGHRELAWTLANLATVRADRGAPQDADSLFRAALAMTRRLFGEEHPEVGHNLWELGILHHEQGQTDSAAVLYDKALSVLRDTYGEEHALTANLRVDRAVLLREQGRYIEAEQDLLDACKTYADNELTRRHDDCIEQLITLYKAWDKPQRAATYRDRLSGD